MATYFLLCYIVAMISDRVQLLLRISFWSLLFFFCPFLLHIKLLPPLLVLPGSPWTFSDLSHYTYSITLPSRDWLTLPYSFFLLLLLLFLILTYF